MDKAPASTGAGFEDGMTKKRTTRKSAAHVLSAGATLCFACTGAGDDPPQPEDGVGDSGDAV